MPDASSSNVQPSEAPAGAKFAFVAGDRDMYHVPAGLPPKEKYLKAIAFLDGGAGRRAAALLAEAVDGLFANGNDARDTRWPAPPDPAARAVSGPVSPTAVAYYWILAIMSGRSVQQLTPDDLAAIKRARSIADREARAELLAAYDVLAEIVDILQREDQGGAGDGADSALADKCRGLAQPYREEIYRHLGATLTGRVSGETEAALAAEAWSPQIGDERNAQAWKYFEQVPAEPRQRTFADPVFPGQGWLLVTLAVVLCLAAVPLAIGVLQERGVVRALVLPIVILLASVIAIRSRITELAATARIADRDSEFGERNVGRYSTPVAAPGIAALPLNPGDDAEAEKARQARVRTTRFTRLVSSQVDEQFGKLAPADQTTRLRWSKETAGLQDSVKNEMLLLYGDTATQPGALNWLIDWRVSEIAKTFRAHKLRAYQQEMPPQTRAVLGFAIGAVVSVVAFGYATFLVLFHRPVQGAIALVLIGFAVVLVALSRVDIYLVERKRLPADRADAEQQYKADKGAHDRWLGKIANPPDDHQVAYWLDIDRIRLKKLFMTQLGLSGQDVLGHATLTEPAPGCVGRRLPYGPPRYSAYKVTIFLLTQAGVRLVATTLNFLTGEAFDPVRRAFRYDTIMSASVQESGIRYDTASRQATPPPNYPWTNGQSGLSESQDIVRRNIDGSVILRQDFRLSIAGGEGLRFLVENFESVDLSPTGGAAEPDLPEDPVNLLDLAFDTSGVGPALELLEVVLTGRPVAEAG